MYLCVLAGSHYSPGQVTERRDQQLERTVVNGQMSGAAAERSLLRAPEEFHSSFFYVKNLYP